MDLQSLIAEKRGKLKHCKTVITNTLGERYEIGNDGKKSNLEQVLPFVVDNNPDLQIARVISGLFLSSQDAAANIEILQEHGIQCVLSIGIDLTVKYENIQYFYCDLLDLPESSLQLVLHECIEIIDECRNKNLLVHCNAGVSRSPTIIISYLIVKLKLSYENAYEKVKSVRPCIRPNDGFVAQLKALQSLQ